MVEKLCVDPVPSRPILASMVAPLTLLGFLGAPALEGGHIGRGGATGANLGERGATGGGCRTPRPLRNSAFWLTAGCASHPRNFYAKLWLVPRSTPDDPSSSSHGFIVWPPNQMSLSASAPMLSLATSTAPAACSRFTTAAS